MRTIEQEKADEELTTAIINCIKVYNAETEDVLTDYIVLCATQTINSDGDVETSHPVLMQDSSMPWYRIFGLVELHKTIMARRMFEDATGFNDVS